MSIFLVLLVWFPSYILSLNVLLRRAYNSIESNTNAGSTSNPGGWLARLGWGLGEATVQVLETSPQESYEARIAFFGRSIPDDGLIGWLVPLDSIVGPCPSSSSNRKPSGTPTTIASSSPPPSFVALDGVYFHGEYIKEEEESELEDIENTGCPPLCPLFGTQPDSAEDSWNPFPNTTWIALVRRGTCSFADKVLFAQSLGASSMIVGGLDENLISMSASGTSGSRIEISSIFVGAASYQNLTRLIKESDISIGVENGTTLNVDDSNKDNEDVRATRQFGRQVPTLLIRLEGEPPWEWYTPILSLLLVLSLPSLLTLCTLVIHRLRAERRERELRAPEDIVKGLPIRVWTGRSWEKDLEQGRRYQRETSETSPLLPVRRTLAEEGGDAPGYGSILDPEPSTSAPRGNRLPVINPRDHSQADLDNKEIIPEEEEEPPRRSPIPLPPSPTQLLAIPTSQHAQEVSAQSDETIPRPPWFTSQFECAICLCDFEIGDRVRVLPCGHVFHLEEVDPWLIKQRRVCPVCKYDVTNPPTALVPASSSQPDLSELAVRTSSAAAALNVDATSDLTTAPHSPNVSNRPILGSEDADHNDAHSSGRPGAEFTIGHGTTASQLLADVDRRRDEDGSRVGFLERWFGRRGDRPESTEEERR